MPQKHGHSYKPEWRAYLDAKYRCENPNVNSFERYGEHHHAKPTEQCKPSFAFPVQHERILALRLVTIEQYTPHGAMIRKIMGERPILHTLVKD